KSLFDPIEEEMRNMKYGAWFTMINEHILRAVEIKVFGSQTHLSLEEEGTHSILFCPGFTHRNIAEIVEAVRNKAGVFVARGDGPSSRITALVRRREL
ncbi:MAG: DUF4932 domain-containing protein, partial [Candidatus Bathyarchaeota archaeon]|nr:DUF4932 domain-containing protein [Candidatus Bathyarchaeota archaeon]